MVCLDRLSYLRMSCKLEVELLAARSRLRDAPSPAGPADRAKAGMGLQSERPDVICMRAALEQFDGPILSLADERTRIQSQWSKIVAAWGHPGPRELLQTPTGIGLLKRCARGDVRSAAELCVYAQVGLSRLPARSITRAQLAASVLGDAHALASGRPAATIVLAALRGPAPAAGDIFSATRHATFGREPASW